MKWVTGVTGGREDGFVEYVIIFQSFPKNTWELPSVLGIEARTLGI